MDHRIVNTSGRHLASTLLVALFVTAGLAVDVDARTAGDWGAESARAQAPIRIIARDYALEAPDSVRSGTVTFEFENRGVRDHELLVGLLKPNVTAADIVAAHQRGLTFRQLPTAYLAEGVSGMLYAGPGVRSPARLVVPFERGRDYLLLCQLRDSVGMPSHAVLGMFKVVRAR